MVGAGCEFLHFCEYLSSISGALKRLMKRKANVPHKETEQKCCVFRLFVRLFCLLWPHCVRLCTARAKQEKQIAEKPREREKK